MKDRILKFIEAENITAAEFADKIGVQRSSVSHVLNGRNNPGYSFIQKIIESFPSINSRWLLTGDGDVYEKNLEKRVEQRPYEPKLFSTKQVEPNEIKKETLSQPIITQEAPEDKAVETVPKQFKAQNNTDKVVSRVLIFYNDHTFEDFRPAQ